MVNFGHRIGQKLEHVLLSDPFCPNGLTGYPVWPVQAERFDLPAILNAHHELNLAFESKTHGDSLASLRTHLDLEVKLLHLLVVKILAAVLVIVEVLLGVGQLLFKFVKEFDCLLEAVAALAGLPSQSGHRLITFLFAEADLAGKLIHHAFLLAVEIELLAVFENLPVHSVRVGDQGGDPLWHSKLIFTSDNLNETEGKLSYIPGSLRRWILNLGRNAGHIVPLGARLHAADLFEGLWRVDRGNRAWV